MLRFSHIGICVAELERSLRFYRDQLGFRPVFDLAVSGSQAARLLRLAELELEAVYLERDGVRIELLHYARPAPVGDGGPRAMNALGLTHLSLQVEDLDALASSLAEGPGRILTETRVEIAESGARALFLCDPDGTLIELVQHPPRRR